MYKYFGLVTKAESSIAYNIVFGMSDRDVTQVATSNGIPLAHVIEIKELTEPQWFLVEPVMAESESNIAKMRRHFFNGGCLMCEYAGVEYGLRPTLHKQPLEVGRDEHNEPIYELGKADFINVTEQTVINNLSMKRIDDSGFLSTLTFWTLRHYLEFVDPVQQIKNDAVIVH